MYYGMPYGAFGDPDRHVEDVQYTPSGSGVLMRIKPSTGLGGAYYQVYVNNVLAGAVFCAEGVYSAWLPLVLKGGSDSITIFRIGATPDYDLSSFSRIGEEPARNVVANWAWAYEVLDTPDLLTLTGWSLSLLRRSMVLAGDLTTRGTIPVSMVVSGSTATITDRKSVV